MSGSTAVTSSATPVKSQKASNNGFEPYWNETDIAVGLEDGTLFEVETINQCGKDVCSLNAQNICVGSYQDQPEEL